MELATLVRGLVDDAAMFPPGNAAAGPAVAAHRDYRASWFAPIVGPLVVADVRLGEVAAAAGDEPLAVSVVNTSGAGGLLSLARRSLPGLQIVAVETALRDLDDLAGNAARVVAAAAALGEGVTVFVEIPYEAGYEAAIDTVEAAGLCGKLRTGGPYAEDTPEPPVLARLLSDFIEADLPFKLTAGLHHAIGRYDGDGSHGFLNVVLAVDVLADGGSIDEALWQLQRTDAATMAATVAGWGDLRSHRVRRRFRSFGCCGVTDPIGDLVTLGLATPP